MISIYRSSQSNAKDAQLDACAVRRPAFTLVELLVVIAIIGVLGRAVVAGHSVRPGCQPARAVRQQHAPNRSGDAPVLRYSQRSLSVDAAQHRLQSDSTDVDICVGPVHGKRRRRPAVSGGSQANREPGLHGCHRATSLNGAANELRHEWLSSSARYRACRADARLRDEVFATRGDPQDDRDVRSRNRVDTTKDHVECPDWFASTI